MARYYESEALIEFVKQNTPHMNGETTMKCVEFAIKNATTADVVPRSEYDDLKFQFEVIDRECDRLEAEESRRYDAIVEAKAEVAREIFEEIEKKSCVISETNHSTGSTRVACYQISAERIAELKKKYTEESDD